MDVEGAVCVVTGASSGIGAATARALADRGASVVLAARRADRLDALSAELPGSLAVPADVTVLEDRVRLVEAAVEAFGQVDVLVNAAGQGLHVPVLDVDPDDLRAVLELNVLAPLALLQLVVPQMPGQGAVVNVSSATTLRLIPGLGGYSATKAALNTLSATARLELAGRGVAVSVVYPRVTATEFHRSLRAGALVAGAAGITPDPPELAARAVLHAVETGDAHVLVDDPPRAIEVGHL